jgi:hypothetical protein
VILKEKIKWMKLSSKVHKKLTMGNFIVSIEAHYTKVYQGMANLGKF